MVEVFSLVEARLERGKALNQIQRGPGLSNPQPPLPATTVFSLIFVWNEYAFALMLTSEDARTAPPAIATMLGRGGIEWSAIAAGTLVFLIPVVFIAFLLRKHLLRGVTFGAIRQ